MRHLESSVHVEIRLGVIFVSVLPVPLLEIRTQWNFSLEKLVPTLLGTESACGSTFWLLLCLSTGSTF